MKSASSYASLVIILLTMTAVLSSAAFNPSDVGPKPSMTFTFEYEGETVEIISGVMLECGESDCSDGAPLEEMGPQGFECSGGTCSALAYTFSDYHQLVIQFSDKTRTSNVFEKKGFSAKYTVKVSGDLLVVSEQYGILDALCCLNWMSTLALETLTAGLLLALFQLPRRLLGWIPLASLVTLPAVWFLFPLLPVDARWVIGLAEGFAVVVEALLLVAVGRGALRWMHALIISLIMNAISFGIGWFFLA